ncbi:MAG: replication-associated recombination protein A [Verrucomicrobia bacterium]|nr:replication-associated recombination protein A [Verrucomicrobiota bacterium]
MNIPLAEKLRPSSLEEIVGQDHLIGEGGFLSNIVKNGRPLSILLWGPPGCGKTTLARLYAKAFHGRFITLSAIFSGSSDLKKIISEIEDQPLLSQQAIIFVDEIHRFNKAQQDIFLPFMEKGTIVLIGATTENPSFALNDALLSRLRVLPVKSLELDGLEKIIARFESKIQPLNLTPEARVQLAAFAQGDARHLLNMIENIIHGSVRSETIDDIRLQALVQRRSALYDKHSEGHFNLISALHKAVRGSDPDAALYWFARMLEGGEDPQFLARRIVRMATEDIGLADPQALSIALDAWRAFDQLGHPEGELALAQAVVYLALSPKSNAIYTAFANAKETAKKTSQLSPPKTILNAPTKLMKEMGYSKGYQYDHDTPLAFSGQDYFPEELGRLEFYHPKEYGFEREMSKRIEYFQRLRERLRTEG